MRRTRVIRIRQQTHMGAGGFFELPERRDGGFGGHIPDAAVIAQ
jgi:hypothetical protein